MPKGRHLKPEFFTDKHIVSMSPLARLLYQGLWCYAADCGHLDDEPIELKMRILPADNCDVEDLLAELVAHGRITRQNGAIEVPKLNDHARIDKRYETVCDACKARREHGGNGTSGAPNHSVTTQGSQRDHDVTTRADPPNHAGDGDGDGDGDGEQRPRITREGDLNTDPDFIAFWSAYPKREDKGHARKAWLTKVVRGGAPADTVIEAAGRFAAKVNGSDPKFIALPSTWLNGERWADEDTTTLVDSGPREVFRIPLPPPEVADDPARYQQWVRDKRAEWDQRQAGAK